MFLRDTCDIDSCGAQNFVRLIFLSHDLVKCIGILVQKHDNQRQMSQSPVEVVPED